MINFLLWIVDIIAFAVFLFPHTTIVLSTLKVWSTRHLLWYLVIYYSCQAPIHIWYKWCNLLNTLTMLPMKNIWNQLQKHNFLLLLVKNFGQKKLKLTQSDQFLQFSAVHKILSSASKIELMRFIVAINFFSKIEDKR